ncbi:MAG: hypothetical protein Q8Q95_02395 [bacterium]|nr:hypothetical protein [bacterium]
MAHPSVAGELYESITGQLFEIGRQLRQPKGYPYDPAKLQRYLQNAVEGRFGDTVLKINRTQPFNPAQFLGEGWSIWKGPADGDGLSGEEEQDERSLNLTELDLSNIQLVTCLKEDESVIKGEEKLKRLKAKNYVRLDAKIFQTLWENKSLIPESWKEKTNSNTTFISFDGTTLRGPLGRRYVLCLCWGGGGWGWYCRWLEGGWSAYDPSAVLAS